MKLAYELDATTLIKLKWTKIPIRDWNMSRRRSLPTKTKSWNELKSLLGIETDYSQDHVNEWGTLKWTKIPIRDWNEIDVKVKVEAKIVEMN